MSRWAPRADVIGLSRRPPASPPAGRHLACDLQDAEAVRRAVETARPDVIVHAQAQSDVDRCEREPSEAWAMNVTTAEHLCRARDPKTLLLAVSTDYVFDGAKDRPYDEADRPNPVSVYGRSKLEAERVFLANRNAFVVRPSTLFGPARMNFCDLILQRASQGEPIQAFIDQTTSPTYTDDLAAGLEDLVQAIQGARNSDGLPRVYHLTNAGSCRRIEFAERVLELIGAPRELIRPSRMAEQQRAARRPAYTAMTSRHVGVIIGTPLRPWEDALRAYLAHHPIMRQPAT